MPLDFVKPSNRLDDELKEVCKDATSLCEAFGRTNAPLPGNFPKQSVFQIAKGLQALPNGTARGCLRPLIEAQSQLASVRSEHIIYEAPHDPMSNAPPLFRGEQIDQCLRHLMSSVSTALQAAYQLSAEEPEFETADERIKAPSDVKTANLMRASENLENDLTETQRQFDSIRKPASEQADNLSRRLTDVHVLNWFARGEMQFARVATHRLKRITATMREYPTLIKKSARLIKVGADVADYAHKKWSDFEDRLFKAGTDTIREVADEVDRWAESLEQLPEPSTNTKPIADVVERKRRLGPTPHDLPPGWRLIDRNALAAVRAHPPALDLMVQFFDGILPTWQLALAPGVQPRAVSERLASRFRAVHAGASKPKVILLGGAGGEGKSTAMLHAAAALIEDPQQVWTCLHRQAANAGLPEDTFAKLPMTSGHAWIVVIDDADNIPSAILAAVKVAAARTDVHLLLAARDADWQLNRLVPGLWQPAADFSAEPLAGLDKEDARRIVAGWAHYGDAAMGVLKGRSEADAAWALLGHAREFATRREDGELLGALLVTRQGDDMRAHVRTLVNGLRRDPVIKTYSLRDVYAMVAAMHAENQLYLSRPVLAFAIGCDVDELERKALQPLRREAMLDAGESVLLSRHRRIAEAACAVMRDDDDDIDRWYPMLAGAACRLSARRAARHFDANMQSWTFGLARHFLSKGESHWPLARNVAKAVYEGNPGNTPSLTAYASVLRDIGCPDDAMKLLKADSERLRNDRIGLNEWANIAGKAGDQGLAIWLGGRTLADGGELTEKNCKLGLAGLGVAFREVFAASHDKAFATARAACGQLGLRLRELDATTRGYFEQHAADGQSKGIFDLVPEKAVDAIRKAVILGANEVEPDNDPLFFERLLGEPSGYRYAALLRVVSRPPA